MAYTKVNWQDYPNTTTPVSASNLSIMDDGIYNLQNVQLIAVTNTAPSECAEGDKYYNTSTGLIYTATGTNTWGQTGETPIENIFYIVLDEQTTYTYDGNNLISVGGGSSAGGGETLKIGTILPFSGGTLPTGYLFCDGSAISRTEYAGLFNVIGTSFGAGDGSTTFNLPNLKGKVPVGLDSSDSDFDTIGETGGEKTHTLTQSELPNYNLKGLKWANSGGAITLDSGSHTPGYNLNYGYNGVNEGQIDSIIINSGGSNTPHNILQPYVVVNYIIKASQTTPVQAQIVDSYSESTTDGYSANYINKISNYSTTEQVIGKWIDGKPLYRKCFKNTGNVTTIQTGISNMDDIIRLTIMVKSSDIALWRTIPWCYNANSYDSSYTGGAYVRADGSSINFQAGTGLANTSEYIAIIEYTKTTD